MKVDHYKVLDVPRDASMEDLQRAFRGLALRYHPDRNAAPDAASKMMAINEAWKTLSDPHRRQEYDALLARPAPNPEYAVSILLAARDVVYRSGWRVLEDHDRALVVESARQKLRVLFMERVDNATLMGISRQSEEFCVALSLSIEGPIGSFATAIDLLHSEKYGASLPEGPCRALFAPFL
jgi:curved DNA-binding protein CbpA